MSELNSFICIISCNSRLLMWLLIKLSPFLNPAANLMRNNAFISFTTHCGRIHCFVLVTAHKEGELHGKWRMVLNEGFPLVKLKYLHTVASIGCKGRVKQEILAKIVW
jgi:hypothetical protein